MLPAMPGDSNFLEDTIFTLSDIWYNIYVIHRNGLEESFFLKHIYKNYCKMSKHATADFRQKRFKSHHHFVLESENFANTI